MKKMLFSIVIISLLVLYLPLAAFAIEFETPQRTERAERITENKEAYRERITLVVQKFAPDLLSDITSSWAEHDSVHEELENLKADALEAKKEETKLVLKGLKADIDAGTITRDEAKEMLQEMRAANQARREEVRADIDELKVLYDVDPEDVKLIHKSLSDAVIAQDAEAVYEALELLIDSLQKHILFDQMKIEYFRNEML